MKENLSYKEKKENEDVSFLAAMWTMERERINRFCHLMKESYTWWLAEQQNSMRIYHVDLYIQMGHQTT